MHLTGLQLGGVIRVACKGVTTEVVGDVDLLSSADPDQTALDIIDGIMGSEIGVTASLRFQDLFNSLFQAHSYPPCQLRLTTATILGFNYWAILTG
jgi:hypothetical protein